MNAPKPALSIMLVDDNRDAVELMRMVLEMGHGLHVRTATSGQAALDALADFKPDVFVIDIAMPGMTGHELARKLRELPEGRSALLIAVSGWTRQSDAQASLMAGCDQHFIKPVDTALLVSTIEAWHRDRPR
jgi:CheY-like chemotaxis protein